MKIFGLTGGIASGKTTASQIFSTFNVPIVSADKISKEIFEREPIRLEILSLFGTLDRIKLRQIIFSDLKKKKQMENLLHPLIESESLRQWIQYDSKGESLLLYEAPLLIERLIENDKWKIFSGVILVVTPEKLRLKRLLTRDNISEKLAYSMIASQLTEKERKHFIKKNNVPFFVLDNSKNKTILTEQIKALTIELKSGSIPSSK